MKILDTYDIYNEITSRIIGTIEKTKFMIENNNNDDNTAITMIKMIMIMKTDIIYKHNLWDNDTTMIW